MLTGLVAGATDLVPERPGAAPNYWCTWSVQNYVFGQGAAALDTRELEGAAGYRHAQQALTEDAVFGPHGWANSFFPAVRADLYLLFDDGLFRDGNASFQVDERKFPSLAGLAPEERIRRLDGMARAAGWRGAALWCRTPPPPGDAADELVRWSLHAGVSYWKIDGGDREFGLIGAAARLHPKLVLEHVQGAGPFNGDWQHGVGRYGAFRDDWHESACLMHSDVFRTYDVSPALSFVTTLDRAAEALRWGNSHAVRALVNVEDEVCLAATLGCAMGVMRHPLAGLRPDGDPDPFFKSPRHCKRRCDEVVRALRWQRLAAPFADSTRAPVLADDAVLVDSWTFKPGETWLAEAVGRTVRQGAPARVSRGLPLPEVRCDGEPPFVVAGRFPSGAVAVLAGGRISPDRGWWLPLADVRVDLGSAGGPIACFGRFRSLVLRFARPLDGARVLAQDLAARGCEDVTSQVRISGRDLTIDGGLIDRLGLSAATSGDLSDPGLLLEVLRPR